MFIIKVLSKTKTNKEDDLKIAQELAAQELFSLTFDQFY